MGMHRKLAKKMAMAFTDRRTSEAMLIRQVDIYFDLIGLAWDHWVGGPRGILSAEIEWAINLGLVDRVEHEGPFRSAFRTRTALINDHDDYTIRLRDVRRHALAVRQMVIDLRLRELIQREANPDPPGRNVVPLRRPEN